MFYFAYLLNELGRRRARTVAATLCTAIAAGLTLSVIAVADGVSVTQSRLLAPLSAIGADLVVTRDSTAAQSDPQSAAEMWSTNADAVKTDLAELGKPGDHFSRDFFLPGTQLTMPAAEAAGIAQAAGAQASSAALAMIVTHQEGTVPKIVASFQTGGQTINIDQPIAPMTPAEISRTNACIAALRGSAIVPPPGSAPGKTGTAPPSPAQIESCMPIRFRRFQATIVTPQQTVTQILNPPQTDIASRSYTVLGVDTTRSPAALSKGQISSGRFFSANPDVALNEAVVGEAYAARHQVAAGASIKFNDRAFTVVGIARSVIGLQAADVYLSLPALQSLAHQDGNVNLVLVRLPNASDVDLAARRIQAGNPGLRVVGNRDLAINVSGSVAAAGALTDKGARILVLIVFAVAAALVSILSWSGVHARSRELGTLRAIGWSRSLVVRQVLGESLAVSLLGALIGAAAGLVAGLELQSMLPPLTATAGAASAGQSVFGVGNLNPVLTSTASLRIVLVPTVDVLLSALAVAVGTGVVAGMLSAFRTARVVPIQAVQRLI